MPFFGSHWFEDDNKDIGPSVKDTKDKEEDFWLEGYFHRYLEDIDPLERPHEDDSDY